MSEISANGRMADRPACAKCGGTGYVYLWSMERARGHTWFCDRCKLSWLAADSLAEPAIVAAIVDPVETSTRRVGVDVGQPVVAAARIPATVGGD